MVKRSVWIMAIGLVLAGGALNSAVGQAYDLTKLKSVCIAVDLSAEATQDHGLNAEAIKNHAYVWLKAKLPRLQIGRWGRKRIGACPRGS